MELLKLGDKSNKVRDIQTWLMEQGYNPGPVDGVFGVKTHNALQEFQGSHLDQYGHPLTPDGIVGPSTVWALRHASGDDQRSHIDPLVPRGLTPQRTKLLDFACDLYREDIHEVPDGSNGGDGVDKITNGWKAPWCGMAVHYIFKEALGTEPFGSRATCAAVINIYNLARDKDWFRDKSDYDPRPGDVFIMLYRDSSGQFTGKGHTGIVLRVSEEGRSMNCIEGNAGNRLKCSLRHFDQHSLIGFVNPFQVEENKNGWTRGIMAAGSAPTGVAGTR